MEGRTVDYGGIGWAVNHMRHGHKMKRRAWQNIEWVAYVPAGSVAIPQKFADAKDTDAFLVASSKGGLAPWNATQADLLGSDWELVNATKPGEYHDTPSSPEPAPANG